MKLKAENEMLNSELATLQAKTDKYRKALEEIENFSAWNDPIWRIAHEALEDENL